MKVWICLLLAICLLIGGCLGALFYLQNSAQEIIGMLPAIESAVQQQNWTAAKELFLQIQQQWQQQAPYWMMLINHDAMRDIELSFVDLEIKITQEDTATVAQELATTRFYLEHIPKSETLTYANIF